MTLEYILEPLTFTIYSTGELLRPTLCQKTVWLRTNKETKQHLAHLESFHVFVFNAVNFLQEVAEAVNKLFLFEWLDDVATLGALFNHSVHDVGVTCMLCRQKRCHVHMCSTLFDSMSQETCTQWNVSKQMWLR